MEKVQLPVSKAVLWLVAVERYLPLAPGNQEKVSLRVNVAR